jgi:hypothetical protein
MNGYHHHHFQLDLLVLIGKDGRESKGYRMCRMLTKGKSTMTRAASPLVCRCWAAPLAAGVSSFLVLLMILVLFAPTSVDGAAVLEGEKPLLHVVPQHGFFKSSNNKLQPRSSIRKKVLPLLPPPNPQQQQQDLLVLAAMIRGGGITSVVPMQMKKVFRRGGGGVQVLQQQQPPAGGGDGTAAAAAAVMAEHIL